MMSDDTTPTTDELPKKAHDDAADTHDDDLCWVCGAAVNKRHCKIVCPRCGFMRDCSDP